MPELEQTIIITKDPNKDSDRLEREFSHVPGGFSQFHLIGVSDLEQQLSEDQRLKIAIVNSNIPRWQDLVKQLSDKKADVYVFSGLSSVQIMLDAINNGAVGYGYDSITLMNQIEARRRQ